MEFEIGREILFKRNCVQCCYTVNSIDIQIVTIEKQISFLSREQYLSNIFYLFIIQPSTRKPKVKGRF